MQNKLEIRLLAIRGTRCAAAQCALQRRIAVNFEFQVQFKYALMEHYHITPREAELAILLARGFSIALAAAAMNISKETVRHFARCLFPAFDVHTQHHLVAKIYQFYIARNLT